MVFSTALLFYIESVLTQFPIISYFITVDVYETLNGYYALSVF